jgi:hypothetical protein
MRARACKMHASTEIHCCLHNNIIASAGYIFCCAGVFVYQWIKYQETNKGTSKAKLKGQGSEAAAAAPLLAASSNASCGSRVSSFQRSKTDVLQEMQRLQEEGAAALEQRHSR